MDGGGSIYTILIGIVSIAVIAAVIYFVFIFYKRFFQMAKNINRMTDQLERLIELKQQDKIRQN